MEFDQRQGSSDASGAAESCEQRYGLISGMAGACSTIAKPPRSITRSMIVRAARVLYRLRLSRCQRFGSSGADPIHKMLLDAIRSMGRSGLAADAVSL